MAILAAARVLGGHLVHVIVLAGWVLAVLVVLAWPQRAGDDGGGRAGRAGGAQVSIRGEGAWVQGAALGAFAAAVTHLGVMPEHFRESWLYGTFFLVAALGQMCLGATLLTHPTRRLVLAGVLGSVVVILLWGYSRAVGVPVGPDNGATEAVGVLDVVATLSELATVFCGIRALRGRRIGPAWRWSAWSGPMRSALFATAAFMAVVVSAAPKG